MIGLSESTVSLAWFPTQPRTLVAGQGQKFLRMYDLRGEFFSNRFLLFGPNYLFILLFNAVLFLAKTDKNVLTMVQSNHCRRHYLGTALAQYYPFNVILHLILAFLYSVLISRFLDRYESINPKKTQTLRVYL